MRVVGKEPILTNLDNDPQTVKIDKLARITDMIFKLDELDNTDNLEDGRPSNSLFKYYMFGSGYFTSFEPKTHKYYKLKRVRLFL